MGIEQSKEGEKIYFSEIKSEEYPKEVIEKLRNILPSINEVKMAYIAIVMYEDEMMPHPAIGIQKSSNEVDFVLLVRRLSNEISELVKLGDNIDFLEIVEGGASQYFVESCEPFYVK